MAYKLTPYDRRVQADLMRRQRDARYAAMRERQEAQRLRESRQQEAAAREKNNGLVTALHTVGDVGANVAIGAGKGVEGIVDLLAGVGGAVAGLFSRDAQNSVKEFIARDFTGELYGNAWQAGLDKSALKEGGILEGIAQGVGQMLPSVAVSLIPGVGQAAALTTIVGSAAGTGTEQAYREGAEYGQGLLYGAASGAVEGVTEKLTGGAGKVIKGGILKNAAKEAADVGIKRVAKEAISEGAEEMLSEVANPALKTIYKGRDALDEYGDAEFWAGVGEAGIIGAGTQLGYANTVGRATRSSGVYADAASVMENIDAQIERIQAAEDKGTLTPEQEIAATERIKADYEQLSTILKKASPKARERILQKPQVALAFESDGTLKASVVANLDARVRYAGEGGGSQLMSRGLYGHEGEIGERLAKEGTRIYDGDLTEAEAENLSRLRKAHAALSRRGIVGAEFVVSETSPKFNAYLDGNTVVIGKDTLTDGTYIQKLVHEVEHFAEGTREWAELASFMFDNSAEVNAAIDTVMNSGYGITQQDVDTLGDGLKSGTLTKGQRTLISEVVALRSEALFGNEQTIAKLTRENRTLAEKILDRIKQFLQVFTAKTPEEKAEVKRLQQTERLFERALSRAGTKYAAREMASTEKGNVVLDGEGVVGYNNTVPQFSAKRAKYISYANLGVSNVAFIRSQLHKLYRGVDDGIANGIAIENGNTVYIVDSGKENGNISFGVREEIDISNDELRTEYVRRKNYDAVSKGYISDGLSPKFGTQYDNGGKSDLRQESGAELSTDTRESADIQGEISAGDADRGRSGVRQYSKKITVGMSESDRATILREQAIVPCEIVVAEGFDIDFELLERNRKSAVEKPLIEKMRQLGALRTYKTDAVDVEFEFTRRGLSKSMHSQVSDYGGNLADFAKVVMNMQQLLDAAVLLEIHSDKAKGTSRENARLLQTYVLLSAYKEQNTITPVQFEIKQYVDDNNRLYLAVALTKIEIGVMDDTVLQEERTRLLPISTISIPDLVRKINPQDEKFFKYIPDELLTEEQIRAKRQALIKEAKKYGREQPQFSLKPDQNARDYANRNHEKAYTKKDARKVLTAVLREQLEFGDRDVYAAMHGKRREDVVEQLFEALNTAEPGKRGGVALDIADYIIDNAVVESMDFTDNQEALKRLSTLRSYLHKLDLSQIKDKIAAKHGKKNTKALLWHKADGMSVESAATELRAKGFDVQGETAAELFFAIDKLYDAAKADISEELKSKVGNIMSAEERKQRRQDIAKEILRGFDYTGDDSKLTRETARLESEKDILHERYSTKLENERAQARVEREALQAEYRERLDKKEERFREMRSAIREERRKLRERYERWQEREVLLDGMQEISMELDKAERTRFFSASIYDGATLQAIPNKLRTALKTKRAFTGSIRNTLLKVKDWYCAEGNAMLFHATADNSTDKMADGQVLFDKDIAAMLEELTAGSGELTLRELEMVTAIGNHFVKLVERYQRVFIDGKWMDALGLAEEMVEISRTSREDQTFVTHGIVNKYMRQFGDPAALFRAMDAYNPNGFYTKMHEWMRDAAISMQVDELHALKEYYEWHEKHKKWAKHLERDTIEFRGETMTVGQFMTLYCNTKTDKSKQALADNGFTFCDKDGKPHRLTGLIYEQKTGEDRSVKHGWIDVLEACVGLERELWDRMNPEQREYVKLLERLLNTTCRKWKIDTDKNMKGFSLVHEDGYYFPTVRAGIAKTVDTTFYEGDRVGHLSFNNDVVEGARGELLIETIDDVVLRHVRNMSLYKNYAIVAENRSILQNIDVGETDAKGERVKNVHRAFTIRRVNEERGTRGRDLMRLLDKMSSDLQGGKKAEQSEQSFLKDLVEQIRGNYARFQLGFNPKTLATQLSSLIAAGNILEYNCIVRGIKGFASRKTAQLVDKYCPLAELRDFDNSAALAAGVLETTGKVGDVLMKGIGFVDRRVICSLFNACQLQVQKDSKLTLGTEENLKAAGELLTRVILETQQNSLVTEKSDAMRGGIFSRTFTMFTADGMKVIGRWFDAIGEWSVFSRRLKNAKTDADKARLQKELRRVHGQAVRSTGTLVGQAVYMALIAYLFRLLYDKDEEEAKDNVLQGAWDFAGGLIGGLPIVRDVYSFFTDGYELDNFFLSTINDVLVATKDSFKVAGDAFSGKDVTRQDVFGAVRKVTYAAGQLFGIPVRNAYNFTTGLTRRFVPSVGYTVDSLFAPKAYSTDLSKAIENGDEHMVDTIAGLMLDEKIGIEDNKTRGVLRELTGEGYSVLPRSVGDTLTVNGEEYTLTGKQQKRFRTVYAVGEEAVVNLVRLQRFQNVDAAVQAKAIQFIYGVYWDLAAEDVIGVDLAEKNVLFAEAIDIEKLAIIVAQARALEADKDKNGNSIAGSKKRKVEQLVSSLHLTAAQKYMVMGYLGYKCTNGETQVRGYISRLKLSKTEKQKLLEYSGYAA